MKKARYDKPAGASLLWYECCVVVFCATGMIVHGRRNVRSLVWFDKKFGDPIKHASQKPHVRYDLYGVGLSSYDKYLIQTSRQIIISKIDQKRRKRWTMTTMMSFVL